MHEAKDYSTKRVPDITGNSYNGLRPADPGASMLDASIATIPYGGVMRSIGCTSGKCSI